MFDDQYMQEALKLAKKAYDVDEVPIGCLITHQNQIIARAHNQVEMLKDATAHAEMIALTQASSHLSSKWLKDCTMYVTIEPCSMCAGAIVLSRINRLVIGSMDKKAGACGSVMNIVQHNQLNHHVEISQDICKDNCQSLISTFFQQKRKINSNLI